MKVIITKDETPFKSFYCDSLRERLTDQGYSILELKIEGDWLPVCMLGVLNNRWDYFVGDTTETVANETFETFKRTLIKQAIKDDVNPLPIYLNIINQAFTEAAQEAFAADWLTAKEKYEKN